MLLIASPTNKLGRSHERAYDMAVTLPPQKCEDIHIYIVAVVVRVLEHCPNDTGFKLNTKLKKHLQLICSLQLRMRQPRNTFSLFSR